MLISLLKISYWLFSLSSLDSSTSDHHTAETFWSLVTSQLLNPRTDFSPYLLGPVLIWNHHGNYLLFSLPQPLFPRFPPWWMPVFPHFPPWWSPVFTASACFSTSFSTHSFAAHLLWWVVYEILEIHTSHFLAYSPPVKLNYKPHYFNFKSLSYQE